MNEGSPNQTPLLTTFVPSMPRAAPFQISVHSWVRTDGMLGGTMPDGSKLNEMWEVKVVIDGQEVGVKLFPCDSSWPQIVGKFELSEMRTSRCGHETDVR